MKLLNHEQVYKDDYQDEREKNVKAFMSFHHATKVT